MTKPFFVKYQVHFPDIESLYTYSLFEPFTLPINSDKIVNIKMKARLSQLLLSEERSHCEHRSSF
jgi:hypothetical protein